MTALIPDDLLFYLDEQGGSLVDHQLPGTIRQREKTLKAVQGNPDFNIIPGHLTPCHCSVVSLSEKGRQKILDTLRKERVVEDAILGAFVQNGSSGMSVYAIMRAIRTKTHYGLKHIKIILEEMVGEGKIDMQYKEGDLIYTLKTEE